ncbi:hypothetical protein NMG60_11005351 [Bertholletia excelsa]
MADGLEPYHVPQQSRRDKLRVPGCADNVPGLLPLCDPSLLPSDLLTCAVKEEGVNLMGLVGGSTSQHSIYMDPQPSLHINPSSIQDMNGNPFLYAPQNLRAVEHSFNGGGEVVLSLSSQHTHHQSSLPLELNLQRYEVVGLSRASTSYDLSRSSVPLGPFTGYASVLKSSRFLRPAQQLLDEVCGVGRVVPSQKDPGVMDPPPENLGGGGGGGDVGDGPRKKSRLMSMLDEVYRRYKYYYQHMQAVVASFESVPGLSNAAPYASLALKALSKHFRSLKNAITDQLQFTSKCQIYQKDETPKFGNTDMYGQRPVHSMAFLQHQPIWRPQRGLPERAVSVLRAWLFEHFLHPYPTDTDKLMLAKQTGLSRSQVSNWFINARVRLWKPMVEEIHNLETREAQKNLQKGEQNAKRPTDHFPSCTSLASQNPLMSATRARNDFPRAAMEPEEPPTSLTYGDFSHPRQLDVSTTVSGAGGVSLTLGLHQNNELGLTEPFPINAARQLGLDGSNEGYIMGSFEAQNHRSLGRDIVGGQLLHDFVG